MPGWTPWPAMWLRPCMMGFCWRGWWANLRCTGQGEKGMSVGNNVIKIKPKDNVNLLQLDMHALLSSKQSKSLHATLNEPLCVLHVVCIAWSLLVNVTTGPLLHLPKRIHHSRVGSRMGALEVLVPIGGRTYTTTLGWMRLHPHVWSIRGIALRYVLNNKTRLMMKTKIKEPN